MTTKKYVIFADPTNNEYKIVECEETELKVQLDLFRITRNFNPIVDLHVFEIVKRLTEDEIERLEYQRLKIKFEGK
jgi:hypothetical protein